MDLIHPEVERLDDADHDQPAKIVLRDVMVKDGPATLLSRLIGWAYESYLQCLHVQGGASQRRDHRYYRDNTRAVVYLLWLRLAEQMLVPAVRVAGDPTQNAALQALRVMVRGAVGAPEMVRDEDALVIVSTWIRDGADEALALLEMRGAVVVAHARDDEWWD